MWYNFVIVFYTCNSRRRHPLKLRGQLMWLRQLSCHGAASATRMQHCVAVVVMVICIVSDVSSRYCSDYSVYLVIFLQLLSGWTVWLSFWNKLNADRFCQLITSDKGGGKCFCCCSFICLFVSLLARLLKNMCMDLASCDCNILHPHYCDRMSICICRYWRMKFCVSTDVGTWTNWLTFEPDPY